MWWRRHKELAVALTCADWRLHQPAVNFNGRLARALGVDGVDLIAVPGPDGLLRSERAAEWRAAVDQIKLLIQAHAPKTLAVVAHQRCAGHPVSDDEHVEAVAAAARALKAEAGFAGPVHALVAIYHSDRKWGLQEVGTF
jgi:hypothetical protein